MDNKWIKVKIPEVLYFQEGPGVRKAQFRNEGVKLLNVGNINDNKINLNTTKIFISDEEAYGKYKHFLVDDGDLVIASSGIVVDNFHKKIAFIKKEHLPLCMNTSTIRFKPLSDKIDINYFRYFLQTNYFKYQLSKLITGSAQLNFGPSHLKQIDITLPPLSEQKRIVSILDKANELIEKRKETIELLDVYLKSLFLNMFGDPVTNPMNWKKMKFSELGALDRGVSKHRPRNAPELLGGSHPLIQTGEVANADLFIRKYSHTYSDFGLKQSKKWPAGTLCITIAANIAKTGILEFDSCFPDSIVGFIPDDKITNTIFVHFWLSFLQKILEDSAPESAQKNINLQILRNLDVIVPPIQNQMNFSNKVRSCYLLKQRMKDQLNELEHNFQVLLTSSILD